MVSKPPRQEKHKNQIYLKTKNGDANTSELIV
jgi:hypothetical protein